MQQSFFLFYISRDNGGPVRSFSVFLQQCYTRQTIRNLLDILETKPLSSKQQQRSQFLLKAVFLTNSLFNINPFSCCPHSFKPLNVPFSPALVSEDPGGPLRPPLLMTSVKQTSALSLSQDLRVGTFRRLFKCESLTVFYFHQH